METCLKIRRMCLVEKRSVCEVARKLNVSQTTVYKYLDESTTAPRYERRKSVNYPKLDGFQAQLLQWLEADIERPKRQRRRAMQLYEGLQLAGYRGAYDSIQRFVKAFKSEKQITGQNTAYIPLWFAPGEACQFDWSHEQVILGGVNVQIKLAHFRLCHSKSPYLRAYPRETQERVFDAHVRAFAYYGGVPMKMIYDNPKTIVQTIYQGKERVFNRRFLSLANHYLFEPVPCTPAAGWEKGQVERQVGIMRQHLFAQRNRFADMNDLNDWLLQQCEQAASRPHPEDKSVSIANIFTNEQLELRPITAAFDGYYEHPTKVYSTCVVQYDRNRYSVPCDYVGQPVSIRAYADRIEVVKDETVIAHHERCFGRGQTCFDPWHYVPLLERKPGALRNGAPFVNWELPKALLTLKTPYLKRPGGDRECVQLLMLISQHGLQTVQVACELVLESGSGQLAVITNILHRLTEPDRPPTVTITDAPILINPPCANPGRYDQLQAGYRHA